MRCEIKIDGFDEIRKNFAKAGKQMGEAMAIAANKGMIEIEKQAKYNATRGGEYPEVDTGELVNAITSRMDGKGMDFAVAHVGLLDADAELAIKANSVEYGHVMVTKDEETGEEKTTHVPPKPFIRPALQQTKRRVSNILKTELEKRLK